MTLNPLHNPGNPANLTLGDLTLTGFAISALASYIHLPQLNLCFDMGFCPTTVLSATVVLLSHVHKDHVAGLPLYLSLRDMHKMAPAKVYCPEESREALLNFLASFDLMEGNSVDRSRMVIGVKPGDTFKVGKNTVRVFSANHRLASVGYTVVGSKSKLLPEFVGKTQAEIVLAKTNGIPITETVRADLVTYIGDHTIETLRDHPELGSSSVLIIEATHLGDTPRENAIQYGHTHLDQIRELWDRDPGGALSARHIVLKHFSLKYEASQIVSALEKLPLGLRGRMTPLIPT